MQKRKVLALILILTAVAWAMIFPAFGQDTPKPEAGKPEGAPPEAAAKEKPPFTIARAVIATGVENLEPAGATETFPPTTEKVYCFIEATEVSKDTEVTFVWYHDATELSKFSLPLKEGPRWRTYADKTLYGMKGDWKVEIQDSAGNVVKELGFKVEQTQATK
jgi:hypothetical protein